MINSIDEFLLANLGNNDLGLYFPGIPNIKHMVVVMGKFAARDKHLTLDIQIGVDLGADSPWFSTYLFCF